MATVLILNQDPESLSTADRALLDEDAKLVRFDCRDEIREANKLINRVRELMKTESVVLFSKTYFDPTLIVMGLGVVARFDQRCISACIIYL